MKFSVCGSKLFKRCFQYLACAYMLHGETNQKYAIFMFSSNLSQPESNVSETTLKVKEDTMKSMLPGILKQRKLKRTGVLETQKGKGE